MTIHHRHFVFVIFISLFDANSSSCQRPIFNNVPPPTDRGAWGVATSITQDPRGYMWFGSDRGIYRYDGVNMQNYIHDRTNFNSLATDRVECIFADEHGIIWVGTYEGLDRFDPDRNAFTHYRHREGNADSLINDSVEVITEDRERNLWIGTLGGLDRLDAKTGRFFQYRHDANDPSSLSNNVVRALYVDREDVVWVGTGSPWHGQGSKTDGGLNKLDKATNKFTHYIHDDANPFSLVDNRVGAICEDSHGTFWVGTAGDGLHSMDRATGKFRRYNYDPSNPGKFSRPPLRQTYHWCDDHITFINEDAAGFLWIGTMMNGITRYDRKNDQLIRYGTDKDHSEEFPDSTGWAAYSSRDGVFWVSTFVGHLFRIDPFVQTFPYYKVAFVQSIYKEAGGISWAFTNSAIIQMDAHGGILKKYDYPQRVDNFFTAYRDRSGNFWIPAFGEGLLYIFDPRTEEFTRYTHSDADEKSLSDILLGSFCEDHEMNLWFGTRIGLDKMDRKKGQFIHYRDTSKDTMHYWMVEGLVEDHKNRLWLESGQGEVKSFNVETGLFKTYMKEVSTYGLDEDSEGSLWAGGDFGLFRYNPALDSFISFADPATKLPFEKVFSLHEDGQKRLWVSTLGGLLRLNQGRDSSIALENLVLFSKRIPTGSDKFSSGFVGGSPSEIFVADSFGYYDISLDQVTENLIPPQVSITGFWLGSKSVMPGVNSVLREEIFNTKKIRLNYKQNTFSFDFDVFHYSDPSKIKCFFRLDNYDNDWHTGTQHTASYFNLPPGRYTFRVKAEQHPYGIWAEKKIEVIIDPPWWQTWWAYLLYVLAMAAAIYLIVRWRTRSVRKVEQKKMRYRVEMLELESKALRAQMNPHFIFNCLNSIKALIQNDEKAHSIEYLTIFSKLIRTLFQNSDKRQISLHDEIETCRLYTQLEGMRLNGQLKYDFTIDPNLDLKSVMIPALIIQPFIENAIWHGIIPKNGGTVNISINGNQEEIFCEIDDDGIGREMSLRNKPITPLVHESKGIHLAQTRLNLQKVLNDTSASIETIDKFEENRAVGTKVIIRFSLQ